MSNVVNSIAQVMEFLGNLLKLVRWGNLPNLQPFVEGNEPKRIAAEFEKFAANGFRLVINIISLGKVPIDRSKPFDPATFIGAGWTIWKGPADGDGLTGDEEQDQWSLALTAVDLTDVCLIKTMLEGREAFVRGGTRLERLKKAGYVRLDAKVFQTLWENQHLIPECWKEKTDGNTTYIFFDGTILRDLRGMRCVLYLYWHRGEWRLNVHWLDSSWYVSYSSAVIDEQRLVA